MSQEEATEALLARLSYSATLRISKAIPFTPSNKLTVFQTAWLSLPFCFLVGKLNVKFSRKIFTFRKSFQSNVRKNEDNLRGEKNLSFWIEEQQWHRFILFVLKILFSRRKTYRNIISGILGIRLSVFSHLKFSSFWLICHCEQKALHFLKFRLDKSVYWGEIKS